MIENSSEDRVGDEQRASSMPSDWKVSCTFVAQVMEQYKHQLLGFFYKRILGTKGDAEDLLQETALNLTTHVQKYGIRKIQEKIHGYLFTIAKHVMID